MVVLPLMSSPLAENVTPFLEVEIVQVSPIRAMSEQIFLNFADGILTTAEYSKKVGKS
jgi:hypothetical protein